MGGGGGWRGIVLHYVTRVSLGNPQLDLAQEVEPVDDFIESRVIIERVDYGITFSFVFMN